MAGADVASVDTVQAEGFQMPDQSAVTSTWLGEAADGPKVRNQRHCRRPWCHVEVGGATLEVGSLAHQPLLRSDDSMATAVDFLFECHASQQRGCSQAIGPVPYGKTALPSLPPQWRQRSGGDC